MQEIKSSGYTIYNSEVPSKRLSLAMKLKKIISTEFKVILFDKNLGCKCDANLSHAHMPLQ